MVGFGTDSFLVGPRRKMFLLSSVARKVEMGVCFGNVPFHLYYMLGSLSGMARNLDLAAAVAGPPWAASFGQLACFELERWLGAYPLDSSGYWAPPDFWDADDVALEMSEHPNIWTDGSREDFSSIGGFEVAGADIYLPASEVAFESPVWCVAEEYGDARLERCRAFMPVPGVLQTVQRAEFWSAILGLQGYWPCHLGVDNLHVARATGRLLDRDCFEVGRRSRVMPLMLMLSRVVLGLWIGCGMRKLILLLIQAGVISRS